MASDPILTADEVAEDRDRLAALVYVFLHGNACENDQCRENGFCSTCVLWLENVTEPFMTPEVEAQAFPDGPVRCEEARRG